MNALRQKNYRQAIELFKVVIKRYPNGPYVQPSYEKLSEIEGLAGQRLAPVSRLIREQKFDEAIALLREVRRTFAGSRAAQQADARLEELSKSPALAAAIRKAQAEDLLADAQAYIEASDLVQGVQCYKKLAEEYADTPQGKEAKERLACFDSDEDFQTQLRECEAEAKCQGLFSLARSYRANKLFEFAQAKYQEVIDQYPGTDFAEEAREELEALEKEMEEAGY